MKVGEVKFLKNKETKEEHLCMFKGENFDRTPKWLNLEKDRVYFYSDKEWEVSEEVEADLSDFFKQASDNA